MPRLTQYNFENRFAVTAYKLPHERSYELEYYLIDAAAHRMDELDTEIATTLELPDTVESLKQAQQALKAFAAAYKRFERKQSASAVVIMQEESQIAKQVKIAKASFNAQFRKAKKHVDSLRSKSQDSAVEAKL